jgi:hypothetical protein
MLLCFRLQEHSKSNPVVNNTAAATLRQLIVHMFEKVTLEDDQLAVDIKEGKVKPAQSKVMLPCARDAYLLFQVGLISL